MDLREKLVLKPAYEASECDNHGEVPRVSWDGSSDESKTHEMSRGRRKETTVRCEVRETMDIRDAEDLVFQLVQQVTHFLHLQGEGKVPQVLMSPQVGQRRLLVVGINSDETLEGVRVVSLGFW